MQFLKLLFIGFLVALLLPGCALLELRAEIQEAQYKSDIPVGTPRTGEYLDSLNLDVLFYSQAPFGDWGMPYQEACEEASLLLAYYYMEDLRPTIEQFEDDLLAMIDWEVDYFGAYEHTTIEQTAEMAREYLGWGNVEVLEDPSEDDLKAILAEGYPVVAPFAGRYLGNPYFTGLGPVYHMLVIRGYDQERFITNDVGTQHGENFVYTYDVLLEALHDWDDSAAIHDEGILEGGKRILIMK